MIIENSLICHAGTVCSAIQSLRVEIKILPDTRLLFRYKLAGDISQLRIPEPLPPKMTDGLWEHTCFEAFIAVKEDTGYHEFNFSSSGQWAAYAFSDYRLRRHWTVGVAPVISMVKTDKHLQLDAQIATADLPSNPENKPFMLGLTAVVESVDGSRSYWALQHPDLRPDFHHRSGFMQQLSTASFYR